MFLFLLLKATDIPSLTVVTPLLCGRPTLLAATRGIGCTVINLTAPGQTEALLSLPQDGHLGQGT